MYETEQQAQDAVSKLKSKGFVKDTIFIVTPQAGGTADSITAAIAAAYILKSHARVYAEGILAGRSLVVVHAPFGSSRVAIETLNSCRPVDSGLRLPEGRKVTWDEGAPLSSAIQAPVLLRNSPAPLSRVFGISTCWKRGNFFALFGLKSLSEPSGPLQTSLGMPVLSSPTFSLSGLLGLPLLR